MLDTGSISKKSDTESLRTLVVERIIGLQDVKEEVVMLRTPNGEANIELVKFYTPSDEKGMQRPLANTLVSGILPLLSKILKPLLPN